MKAQIYALFILLFCYNCFGPSQSYQLEQQISWYTARDENHEIYISNLDGSYPANLTKHTASDKSPQFSPDGSQVIFLSDRDGDRYIYDLYIADLIWMGGYTYFIFENIINLSNDVNTIVDAADFSPDGDRIVYESDSGNNYDISVTRTL